MPSSSDSRRSEVTANPVRHWATGGTMTEEPDIAKRDDSEEPGATQEETRPEAQKSDPRAAQKASLQKRIDASLERRLHIFSEIEEASRPGKQQPT